MTALPLSAAPIRLSLTREQDRYCNLEFTLPVDSLTGWPLISLPPNDNMEMADQ